MTRTSVLRPAAPAPIASPATPTTTNWRAVAVVVAAGVCASFHLGKVAIAGPQLQAGLGLSLSMLGALGGTFALLGALGGVAAGSVTARAGDRRMLVLGLAATVLGALLALLTSSYAVLLASRVVEGLGFVLITVAGPTVLSRLVQGPDRPRAMALWSCFMPTGIALAMLTGPWFGGWHSLWAAAALASGAIAALVLATVPARTAIAGSGDARKPSTPARLGDALRGPPLALATTFMLYSLMFFALFSFLPVLLQQRLQAGASTVGLLAALASAANIVGNLAAGALLPRLGRTVLGTAAAVTMGLCALGIFLPVLPPAAAFVLCLVFSAMGGLVPSSLLSSVPQVTSTPAQGALAVGLLMQGSNLGQALGPLLVGNVVDRFGWAAAAVCVVLAALAMGVTVRWRAAAGRP